MQASILDLPDEMLEGIFSYLEFEERLTASLVCRRWNRIALKWNDLSLHLYCWRDSICDSMEASSRSCCSRPRYLKIGEGHQLGELITKFGNSLEELEVSEVEQWDWLSSLCGLPRLKELNIVCSNSYYNLEVSSTGPCPSMRSLTVEKIGSDVFSSFNSFISDTFPELTHLKVKYFPGTFRLSKLPKLEYLEMFGDGPIYNDLLEDLHSLPSLTSINLTGRRLESDFPNETLNIGHIRTVRLRNDDPLYNEMLLKLTEVFPGMTSFTGWWNFCTKGGIEAARKRLPNCNFDVAAGAESEEEENTEPDIGSGNSGDESNDSDDE